ncbi:MAG: tetratricopeptide repeat protein [Candidatus Magasanikbacteria bacterium]|nr:tetratricopeptide repeat protein [Candidatus Magasanikbacteria bacterium]
MSISPRFLKYWNALPYALLVATVVTMPLMFDQRLENFYVVPKQYWLTGLMLLAVLVAAIRAIISRHVQLRYCVIDWAVVAFLAVTFISACLSLTPYNSFVGQSHYFSLNFIFSAALSLWYFFVARGLTTTRRWSALLDVLIGVGGATTLLFIAPSLLALGKITVPAFFLRNTIDGFNSIFGVWLVVIFILATGLAMQRATTIARAILYSGVSLLVLVALTLLSFKMLWWVLLGAVVLLLLLGINFLREVRVWFVSALFMLLVAIVICIVFDTPHPLQAPTPPELFLNASGSWLIMQRTITSGVKNFLVGSGLGNFAIDFSRFRPASFNTDPVAWYINFNEPLGSWFAFVAEGGILLVAAFIGLVFLVVRYVSKAWKQQRQPLKNLAQADALTGGDDGRFELCVVAAAWLFLTIVAGAVFLGPVLWWLWWLLLGLLVSHLFLVSSDFGKKFNLTIKETPEHNLVFSLVIIIVVVIVVLGGVWGARWYSGEVNYAAGLRSSNANSAEQSFLKAIDTHPRSARYYASLAQAYLNEAVIASHISAPDPAVVSALLGKSISSARQASDLSPYSAQFLGNLATMYENAAVLLPEARAWTIKTLRAARELEPTNATIVWRLGNNYFLDNQLAEAKNAYQVAIDLKPDYSEAYNGLASLAEKNGNMDEAISIYQKSVAAVGGQPDSLFNLGRLLFNRNKNGDRAQAEILWLQAIRLAPNFSNAWYSLGLAAESRGDKITAQQYYNRVKELNPTNAEILKKVSSFNEADDVASKK